MEEAAAYAVATVSAHERRLSMAQLLGPLLATHRCEAPNCGAAFVTDGDLRVHREAHARRRGLAYDCAHCGKSFVKRSDLRKHCGTRRHDMRLLLAAQASFDQRAKRTAGGGGD